MITFAQAQAALLKNVETPRGLMLLTELNVTSISHGAENFTLAGRPIGENGVPEVWMERFSSKDCFPVEIAATSTPLFIEPSLCLYDAYCTKVMKDALDIAMLQLLANCADTGSIVPLQDEETADDLLYIGLHFALNHEENVAMIIKEGKQQLVELRKKYADLIIGPAELTKRVLSVMEEHFKV